MENKEFPEQEELLPIEQEVFPPEDPSYEEGALPDEDLLLMDGSEAPEEAPAQEMLPLFPQEEVSEAEEFIEEPPMSDEAFLAFMQMNAVSAEDPAAAPVEEAVSEPEAIPGDAAEEQTAAEDSPEEIQEPVYEEDPLAPDCEVEDDPLARELEEAEAQYDAQHHSKESLYKQIISHFSFSFSFRGNENIGGWAALAFCFRPLALRPILSGGLPFTNFLPGFALLLILSIYLYHARVTNSVTFLSSAFRLSSFLKFCNPAGNRFLSFRMLSYSLMHCPAGGSAPIHCGSFAPAVLPAMLQIPASLHSAGTGPGS